MEKKNQELKMLFDLDLAYFETSGLKNPEASGKIGYLLWWLCHWSWNEDSLVSGTRLKTKEKGKLCLRLAS